jgi:Ca2+-binding EF-hand superfamily protein
MQSYAETIRDSIWGKLQEIFMKYTGGKTSIVSTQIESIVREVLKETDQTEVDYVVKNLFRLDSDGSGSIDFTEFVTLSFNPG